MYILRILLLPQQSGFVKNKFKIFKFQTKRFFKWSLTGCGLPPGRQTLFLMESMGWTPFRLREGVSGDLKNEVRF
jgi:hypothetical protein